MSGNLRRAPISRWWRDHINELGIRAELMSAEDHETEKLGWQGDPSAPGSEFKPYAIIIPQSLVRPANSGMDFDVSDWDVPYLVTVFGVSVEQVEDVCDDIRQLSGPMYKADRKTFEVDGGAIWTTHRISNTNIGGVGWNNQVSPAMYSETDIYTISISRSLK